MVDVIDIVVLSCRFEVVTNVVIAAVTVTVVIVALAVILIFFPLMIQDSEKRLSEI